MNVKRPRVRKASGAPLLWGVVAALGGVVAGAGAFAVTNAGDAGQEVTSASSTPVASESPPPSLAPLPSPTPAPPRPVTFTLVAAGDVLPHAPLLQSAATDAGYDFAPLWAATTPWVAGADLALCHMEVPEAPPGTAASGYPVFGAPDALIPALAAAGWDGCSTASNHSMDKGMAGVVATLDSMEASGLGATGTSRSADERGEIQFYEVTEGDRTVTVAHISAAYGTNGMPVPADAPWAVNLFNADAEDAAPIIALAQEARDAGADVVLASVHCCVEYQTEPTPAQRSVAEQIAASGLVDLYIGHHAHVPQPIELLPGGPGGAGMWTAFGLGNFISNQDVACCVSESANGVIMVATISVAPDDQVSVDVGWVGTTVDRRGHHQMYLLRDIPEGAGTLTAAEVAARYANVVAAVGPAAPELTEPPVPLADQVTQKREATS